VRELKGEGLGATEIAKALGIGRASVYRVFDAGH
jgi:AcrR family transcriptional regulator